MDIRYTHVSAKTVSINAICTDIPQNQYQKEFKEKLP